MTSESTAVGTAAGNGDVEKKNGQALSAGSDADLERQRTIEMAIAEGHDADIPSSIGCVLDERGEAVRRKSIADQKAAHQQNGTGGHTDLEKEAGLDKEMGAGIADKNEEDEHSGEDDANVVWWDGPDDPENPYNWPTWRKVTHCALISALTFITPLASCKWDVW
jgi:hypothetical protein